jgi:hypothetical protein
LESVGGETVILFRTIVLIVTLLLSQAPTQRVKAQAAAVVVPVGAAIVTIAGIAYYVWLNTEGIEIRMPVESGGYLEDAEDSDQWGEYPAIRTYQGCRWQAAGREWEWDNTRKVCRIKG